MFEGDICESNGTGRTGVRRWLAEPNHAKRTEVAIVGPLVEKPIAGDVHSRLTLSTVKRIAGIAGVGRLDRRTGSEEEQACQRDECPGGAHGDTDCKR